MVDARNPGRKISRADHTVSLDDEYSRYQVRGFGWSGAIASRLTMTVMTIMMNDGDDMLMVLVMMMMFSHLLIPLKCNP